MAGPFDYTVQQPNIAGSILGGIQAGQSLQADQQKIQAQQDAAARAIQHETDLQNYFEKPTPQSAAEMMAKYPEFQKSMSASFETLDKAQKDETFKAGTQAISAINSGRPEIAKKILDDRIAAYENSGQDTTDLVSLRKSLDTNPEAVSSGLALTMASLNPEGFSKIAAEMRAAEKAPYELGKLKAESGIKQVEARYAPEREFLESSKTRSELRNIDSQIKERSGRLNLDQDKLQTETELKLNELGQKATTLDDSAKKLVNDAVVSSVAADQAAGQFLDLASQIEKLGGGYGAFGTAAEFWANATGQQDAMSAARREYVRLRNTQAVKNLPPGAASDADVAMALEGFPKETADAKTLSSFLRGTAKLSQIEAVNDNAKSEWVNSVGHLGKPKTDIVIDGVNVPAGTTFTDFTRKYLSEKAGQRGAEQAQQQVPQRSYMKYAQPRAQ